MSEEASLVGFFEMPRVYFKKESFGCPKGLRSFVRDMRLLILECVWFPVMGVVVA